jgi:hypothetical protein
MNKTKKIILSLAVAGITILPLAALAVNNPINASGGPNASFGDIGTVINTILGKLWVIFAGLAVVMFLYAGILFLTAQGAPDKVSAARQAFLWGVVGVVVGILAYSIIAVVGSLIS